MIVDDHPLVREGLAQLFALEDDITVVDQAGSRQEALDRIDRASPDVVIVDLTLAAESGLDLIKELRVRRPGAAALVLSMHDETLYAERCIRAGAQGFVSKHEQPARIIEAVRRVHEGQIHLSARAFEQVVRKAPDSREGRPGDISALTDREMQVFELLGQGLSTPKIAERLALSQTTIRTHRDNIRQKLGVEDNDALVQLAVRRIMHGR